MEIRRGHLLLLTLQQLQDQSPVWFFPYPRPSRINGPNRVSPLRSDVVRMGRAGGWSEAAAWLHKAVTRGVPAILVGEGATRAMEQFLLALPPDKSPQPPS